MKKLAILSLVLAAGAAMATEPGSYSPTTSTSINSRAEVKAEVAQAPKMATGEVGPVIVNGKSAMPRDAAEVRAEAAWAGRTHQTVGEV